MVFFASSIANAKAYLRVAEECLACMPGQRWHRGWSTVGMALGPRHPEASNGTYADELDNQPEYRHTDPRDPAGPGKQGRLVLGGLTG
jgi:hypothetical protein